MLCCGGVSWAVDFIQSVLFQLVLLVTSGMLDALPRRRESIEQTPAEDRSWFKKKGPEYEINPNFGFRSYHQVRYEPMTVPMENEYQAPLPPLDALPVTLPIKTGAQQGSFLDDGYAGQPSNNEYSMMNPNSRAQYF